MTTSAHKIAAEITAEAGQFIKGFRDAESAVGKFMATAQAGAKVAGAFGSAMDELSSRGQAAGLKMAAVGGSVGLSLATMAKGASTFQAQMLNVNTVMQGSANELAAVGNEVISLSRRVPQTAKALADGLYDVSSSGFAGAEGLMVMNAASVAASAGVTDTATSVKGISAILNAYGLEASSATDVSDILFQTVNLGVITFEELSNTVGDWVGIASAAGVAADEASAAIAAMTLSGINSSEAATSLSRLIQSFIDPSEELTKVARDMGHESALAMLENLGLAGSMERIREHTGGAAAATSLLFDDVRALKGALALAANEGENYTKVAGAITDEAGRAGASQAAFEVQSKGLGVQFQLLQNSLMALSLSIGQTFLPTLTLFTKIAKELVDIIGLVPAPVLKVIGVFAALSSVGLIAAGGLVFLVAKTFLWQVALGFLGRRMVETASGMTGMGAASSFAARGLAQVGTASAFASKTLGPLNALTKGTSLGMNAIGLGASTTAGKLARLGGATLLAGGLLLQFKSSADSAREALEATSEQMKEGFDTTSLEGATTSIEDMRSTIQGLFDQEAELGTFGGALRQAFSTTFGLQGFVNPFADDGFTGENPLTNLNEEQAQAMAVYEDLNGRLDRALTFTRLAITESRSEVGGLLDDVSFGGDSPGFFDVAAAEEYSNVLRDVTAAQIAQIATGAEASGIDFTPILDGTATADQVEAITRELVVYVDAMGKVDAATAEVDIAFLALGDDALLITDRIDAMGDAFDAIINRSLGLEGATDNIFSSINSMTESIMELKESGDLADAMNLNSASDDAIALRRDTTGLLSDITAQTLEWAKAQEDVTGIEIQDYLKAQQTDLRKTMEDWGLSEEFINHYVDALGEVADHPDLVVAFNDNLDSQTSRLQTYLAELGLADKEIVTAVEFADDEAFEALEAYVTETLGLDGFVMTQAIDLDTEDAIAEIQNFKAENEISDEDFTALVTAQVAGDQEGVTNILTELETISEGDWLAMVDSTGLMVPRVRARLITEELENLVSKDYEPAVELDTSGFDNEYEALRAKLSVLQQYANSLSKPIVPKVSSSSVWTPPPGFVPPTSRIPNADGGHYPTIARGGPTRIWNEPETGGEAYIPLGMSKRASALPILMQVMDEFGITRFASGGTSPFYRPDQNSRVGGSAGTSRPSSGSSGSSRSASSASSDTPNFLGFEDLMDWMDLFQNLNETGAMSDADYKKNLQNILKGTDKFSDDYMRIWREIQGIDEDAADAREEAAREAEEALQAARDEADRLISVKFATGNASKDQYLAYLNNRLKGAKKYSEDWFNVWQEIEAINEEAKRSEEEKVDEARRIEALRHEIGEMSNSKYLAVLRKRLAGLDKYSEEWASTWREIQSLEEEVLSDNSSNRLGAVSSQSFLSTSQLAAVYERKARDAVEWYSIVQRLSASGVSPVLIQDMLSAGPDSLPMARALERMKADGTLGRLETNLAVIDTVSGNVEKKIGNVSGPVGALGTSAGSGGVTITGDLYFAGIDDVKEMIRDIEFALAGGAL